MGFFDSLTDLWDAATPWSTVEAEAVQRGGAGETKTPADADDGGEGEAEDPEGSTPDKNDTDSGDQVGGKDASGVDTEGEDDEKEEEEEEEELVDPKEHFEEECRESKQCAPAKHHFEECVERVTGPDEGKKYPHEDCVEEFFHLAHCAGECAAPKIFAALK